MPLTILYYLLLLSSPFTPASKLDEDLGPEITFSEQKFDFGNVKYGKKVTHAFSFTNTGNEALVIRSVKPTCGCTITSFTKESIAPGGNGVINVTFSPKTKTPGFFIKSIMVFSNAKNSPHTIFVKGEIVVK